MNSKHLQQIFSHYTEKFEYVNNPEHDENYKWQVAKTFRELMDDALAKDGEAFAEALYKAKASTQNIIDSYTQPFHGLVEFARKEPDTVKKMFQDLYSNDGGDLKKQEALIDDFFTRSNELLEKYNPGSYRFKQNSHSVSAYLFLYDPDHHYMFKATQASIFADCIEFYEDWGTGDNIKLKVFYKMCDEMVDAIKQDEALVKTDESRFDGRFRVKPEQLFPDQEKHMLAFDIIYCCSVYDLFDGISFKRPKTKEKVLFNERKAKARQLYEDYQKAQEKAEQLILAKRHLVEVLPAGCKVIHRKYGQGIIDSTDEKYVNIDFESQEEITQLDLGIVIGNGIIKLTDGKFDEMVINSIPLLKKQDSILHMVDIAKHTLEPYEEYLD